MTIELINMLGKNMIGEVWRVVPSVPALMVSNEGRVMRVPYMGVMPNGGRRCYGGQPNFGVWSKQDGRFITVHKGKTYKIHRLICEAFNGQPSKDKYVCMHLDENPVNNRAYNLKWGTQKENLNAEGFIEYCRGRTGGGSPTAKHRRRLEADHAPSF